MATGDPDKHPGGGTVVWKPGNVPGNPVADQPETKVRGSKNNGGDRPRDPDLGYTVHPPTGACH